MNAAEILFQKASHIYELSKSLPLNTEEDKRFYCLVREVIGTLKVKYYKMTGVCMNLDWIE